MLDDTTLDDTTLDDTTREHASTWPTLGRDDYTSPDVFEAERRAVFRRGWMYVAHASSVPPGSRRVVELAGESVIVTRDRAGDLHALANVCRHRGARLCEPTDPAADGASCMAPSLQCPYHAWTYSLDGALLATPRVDRDEVDRDEHPLWSYRAEEWNGLVFVSLAPDGPSLLEWLTTWSPDLLSQFAELPLADMVVLQRTVADVAANWKIVVENYQECLHCAVVHPELVEIVPVYRTGNVLDPTRDDGAVELAGEGNSFSLSGAEDLPTVPGLRDGQEHLYRGSAVFPNLFVDVTGTGVSLTTMLPVAADRTIVVGEYLFSRDVEPARPDHRDAVAAVVAFNELVGAQDYAVCESVQQGVGSSAFTHGVLTAKDALVAGFDEQYRSAMGTVDPR